MMNKFVFQDCEEGQYLCAEMVSEDTPDISKLTGFGGIKKGTQRFMVITRISMINNKPYMVYWKYVSKEGDDKEHPLLESWFDKNESDIWELPTDFFNPFKTRLKFYVCDEEDLPKYYLRKLNKERFFSTLRKNLQNFFVPSIRP